MSLILDQSVITSAVEYLKKGELVAFPTETVYGLAADASNEKALQKLYTAKGRPANHPVIVHLASFEQMSDWCVDLPDYARLLARKFWPGPLTMIVKKAKHVSSLVTGGQDTIGLRVPAHPLALALLKAFSGGVAAPSANKYGRLSATCAEHVTQEFGDEVSVIIDGGSCPIGIESTIVDVIGSRPRVLRPGIISEEEILRCVRLDTNAHQRDSQAHKKIRVPGSDKSHYAPKTPLLLLDKPALKAFLAHHKTDDQSNNKLSYAVLAFAQLDELVQDRAYGRTNEDSAVKKYIQAIQEPKAYARELYANLRKLDNADANYILVEALPSSIEWHAVADRLLRAATKLQSRN